MAIDLGVLVVRLQADMRGFTSGLSKAQERLKTFSARLQGSMQANAAAMQRFGRTAVVAGLAVQGALIGMTKKFGDFELAMRKATTATDITEREFAELSSFVEKQATALNIAAVKAAEGIKFLGFAGLTAQQQMQAFPPLLALSKAGMADMGDVTERLLGVMGAFQIGFERTGEVADKIAKIWGSSQQTLEELTQAFSFTAAGAAEMGISIGELGALTALMAQAGIKGSRAGTALRRTFLNLKAPTSELRTLLADLNISVEDSNGKFRNGIDVLDDFFRATEDMGDAQRAMAFKVAFGARAVEGLTVVANKGIKSLREFADSIENADGTIDIMVERRMKALNEQLGIAAREFGTLFRAIGQKFEPEARQLAETMKDVAESMGKWIDENEALTKVLVITVFTMGGMVAVVGALTIALAGLAFAATALSITMGALVIKMALVTGGLTLLAGAIALVVIGEGKHRGELTKGKKALEDLGKSIDANKTKWQEWDIVLRSSAEGMKVLNARVIIQARLLELQQKLVQALAIKQSRFARMAFGDLKGRAVSQIRQEIELIQRTLEKPIENRAVAEVERLTDAVAAAVPEIRNSMSALKSVFVEVGETIGDSMVDNFTDSITAAQTWSEAILNIVNDMTREITRAFTRMFLQQVFRSAIFGGPGGLGDLLFPIAQPAATQSLARGGIVQPVFAARGFVARGTDTVPAMLTPGEMVIPKRMVDAMRGGGGGGTVNITVTAIDAQNTFQFLNRNKSTIASMIQSASAANHPIRRGQG